MKDVIVITGCTHKDGLVDVYLDQLTKAGVEHLFEIMVKATNPFDITQRLSYWRDLAERHIDYKMIIVTDSWDVLFFGTKEELSEKLQTVTISAERNCFPGPQFGYEDLTNRIGGSTPWRYANPGIIAANPVSLLEWLDKAEKTVPYNSDQAWCNHQLANNSGLVHLDETTNLFYVVSYGDGRLEDSSLQVKDGRLWNSRCNTFPNFFHFAGHGPLEAQRVLPGQPPPRYATMNLIRRYMESR